MAGIVKGQFALRPKGTEKCIHHQKILELKCNTCTDLACVECVTSLHEGHSFRNLKDVVPEAKEEINSFINNTEKREIPDIQQAIISAKDTLKKDTAHFDDIEKDILKQLEKLKKYLDSVSADIISSYRQIREENTGIFTGYIKTLETRQDELRRFVNECKNVLQEGSHVSIYDVRNDIQCLGPLPGKPMVGSASFTPNTQPLDNLKNVFGTVTISHPKHEDQVYVKQSVGHYQPSSTQSSTIKDRTQVKIYNILTDTKVITEFNPPCTIGAICISKDGQIYTTDYSNTVTRLNKKGEEQQEIKYKVPIRDVRVSPTTQHIWTCSSEDCSVVECVPSNEPVVKFNTENKPACLCVTVDNCILIAMSKQITKYTTEGKILLTTKRSMFRSMFRQPVVRTPVRITECSVTHNVAVVDWDYKDDGGDGKRHVLVMDRNFQEIFRYRGDIPAKYQQTIKRRKEKFNPLDVRYDSAGNLVISDFNRCCVHLLSGGGDYLTLIYTGDTEVYSVSVDINNALWVVTGDKVTKLLQYYKTDV